MMMEKSSHSKFVGIGDVCIQTDVGCTLTLKNVQHVPDLSLKSISKSALMDHVGYEY